EDNVVLVHHDGPDWWRAWTNDGAREAMLVRWEREIGMRVNLDTAAIERVPTPGPAYEKDPLQAPRCR
ncbi:MAG: hypothetical protein RDV41_14685, partial [Planctomycetota bacterium]|nr:hypothetical protein [Planctomycetota bacterium]